jgi:hypothetical protein
MLVLSGASLILQYWVGGKAEGIERIGVSADRGLRRAARKQVAGPA